MYINTKLSIVVPVYNVEQYVEECIRSLLHPTEMNYEVVVVNDGTLDHSIDIVRDNIHDERVRIINKDNGGLSSARNFGIKHAKGEYVWCFDSDDWAETELIPDIISKLNGLDLLTFNKRFDNYEDREIIHQLDRNATTGRELACLPYDHGAPFYIYRKVMLEENRLMFKEGLLHEDSLFTPMVILKSNKVFCYDKPVYHYRRGRQGAITSVVYPKRLDDLMYVVSCLVDYGKSLDADIKYGWGRCIVQLTNELLFCSMKCDDKDARDRTRDYVNNNRYLIEYLSHSNKKSRIMALLSQVLFGNLYATYSLLYRLRYGTL